jgi:hypothetical protein
MTDRYTRGRERASKFSKGLPVRFEVGNTYTTISGEKVKFVSIANEGSYYETIVDEQGRHRYSNPERIDMGRLTGTSHHKPNEGNVLPLYNFAVVPNLEATHLPLTIMSEEEPAFYFDNGVIYLDIEVDENGLYSIYFVNRETDTTLWIDESNEENDIFAWYFGALHGFTTNKEEAAKLLQRGLRCTALKAAVVYKDNQTTNKED